MCGTRILLRAPSLRPSGRGDSEVVSGDVEVGAMPWRFAVRPGLSPRVICAADWNRFLPVDTGVRTT